MDFCREVRVTDVCLTFFILTSVCVRERVKPPKEIEDGILTILFWQETIM
jgi:hypothetical protein